MLYFTFSFLILLCQYCTEHGCLLVDESNEFFLLFHFFTSQAVEVVAKALSMTHDSLEAWESLHVWCSSSFTGEESFVDVRHKLLDYVEDITDYLSFIMDIPFLNDFLCIVHASLPRFIVVTLIMSLAVFKNFCYDNKVLSVENECTNRDEITGGEDAPSDPVVTKEQEEAEVEWKDTFYKRSG
jgi:hypothetical protein